MFKFADHALDAMIAPMVERDDGGRTIVYPMGFLGRGIVAKDDAHGAQLKKTLKVNLITTPLAGVLAVQFGLLTGLAGCLIYFLLYAWLLAGLARGTERSPAPLFDGAVLQGYLARVSPTLSVVNFVIALCFTLIGALLYAADNRWEGAAIGAFFALVTILTGYMLFLRLK